MCSVNLTQDKGEQGRKKEENSKGNVEGSAILKQNRYEYFFIPGL